MSTSTPTTQGPPTGPGDVQQKLEKIAASLEQGGGTAAEAAQVREVLARLADFLQLNPAAGREGNTPLDFLMDVTVPVSAELGHATLPIGEVLKLQPGSVVELDRDVTQLVDLTVRGVLFARGEVVVVEDRFAVRIKELIHPRGAKKGSQ
jgi:flagellar motor switch protein FliN/FliY